jgi:hypothetical protein
MSFIAPPHTVSDTPVEALWTQLSQIAERERPGVRLEAVETVPVAEASSWHLVRLDLKLSREPSMSVIFKDLSRSLAGHAGQAVKPHLIIDATREVWAYQVLLSSPSCSAPRLLQAAEGPSGEPWLFLEVVEGSSLAITGFGDPWLKAARWLAWLHARVVDETARAGPLLLHSRALHRGWFSRARRYVGPSLSPLASAHEKALSLALEKPSSIVHGEFYPANVLVEESTGRIRPVDWETVGIGPSLVDLAALSTGLAEDERSLLLSEYREELRRAAPTGGREGTSDLEIAFHACRLLLAVQWLGWANRWDPPPEQRFDWLEEAELAAQEINR